MNKRRDLLVALGAVALVTPLACFAQRPDRVWRVGFLSARSRPVSLDSDEYSGFPQGMRELGYVEGKNLVIDWRYAEGKYERLPELVAELVRLKVDVIVAPGSPVISAAQKAGAIVPIVAVVLAPAARVTEVSSATALATLAILGATAAYAGGASTSRGAVRVAFWGALAMGITAAVGKGFGTAV